ncbi:MAG: GNAT family N-acetyltransferase [Bacteroidetes bacterium]|nr:GNAT family N-acetyltransferase [Bacteroidota bacterium]
MSYTDFVLNSGRIVLEGISEKFKEEIFKEFDEEITRYMHPKPPVQIQETITFIRNVRKDLASGSQIVACVLTRDTHEFLGCVGLHDINSNCPELGVWIKKSAHGNGYGKEAIQALKKWADEHLDYQYIKYPVDVKNVPSRRIPESMGGVVGRVYQQKNLSGRILDIFEYRIFC